MIIPVIFIIGNLVGAFLWWLEREDYNKSVSPMWFFLGYTIIILWSVGLSISRAITLADIAVIDDKIDLTEKINQERIEQVLPILEKYPAMEREVIGEINPEAFAVLGDVYPDLKSNDNYVQQAQIVQDNINKVATLKEEKISYQRDMYIYQRQLWFLN